MRGHQGRSGPAGRGQGQDQGHVGRPATHSRSVSFSEHTSSSAGPTAFGHSNGAGTSNAVRSSLMTRMPDHARQNTRPSAGSASVRLAPSPGNSIFSPSHSDPSGYTPRPAHHFDPGAFAALLAPSDSLTATALPSDLSAAWANFSASAPSLAPNIAPPMPLRSQDDLDLFNAYNAYMELTRPATDLGTTPYTCAYCDKSFGRSDVRAKHVATMHADQPAMPAGSGVGGEERGRRGSTAVSGSREEEDDEGEEDGDEVDEEALRPRKTQRTESFANLNLGAFAQPALPITHAQNSSPIRPPQAHMDFPSALNSINTGSSDQSGSLLQQQQWMKPDSNIPNLSPTGQLSLQNNMLDPGTAINNSLGNIFDSGNGTSGIMLPPSGMNGTGNMSTSTGSFGMSSHSNNAGVGNTGFLDPSLLHVGSSLNAGHDPMISGSDLFDPLSGSWPVLNNIFGWGMSSDMDMDLGLQLPLFNQHVGATSSTEHLSAAWLMSFTPQVGSPADGQQAKEEQERQKDPFGRNHEDPWPSYFKPVMPDRPLTLGGVKARPRPGRPPPNANGTTEPPSVGANSRNAMLSLVYLSHQTHWMMPDIQDFPDADTLSDWVDLYFENFHPSLPVLHRPTWKTTDVPAVLMLAVAAIGATYADAEFKPITVSMGELVRRMVQWLRASDQRSKFDNNVTLAYLLQVIAGMACGSRELMLHTEISRASLVTSLRRLHLLRPGRSALEQVLSDNAHATSEAKWKAWLEDEGRRRFGWSLFLLDQQSSSLLDTPAVTSISEARVSLPADDRLWDAPDAQSWEKVLQEIRNEGGQLEVPFLPMLHSVLNGGTDLGRASPFSRSIIAHTVYRLSHDAHQLQSALVDPNLDTPANTDGYAEYLSGKPYRALHNLALALTPTSVPSYLQICSAALYHHSRIALSRTGLLLHAKAASGKFEPDVSKPKAIMWLQKWATNKKEVRRVLWHAGVLNALLSEFPRGHFAEPFWAFDCALIFWVIIKYGQESVHSSELKSALFAANWFDVDPPNMWITHGGQIFLPFLGSSTAFKIRDTLEHFIRQMGAMPWGLAAFQKQVLTLLLDVEDGKGAER